MAALTPEAIPQWPRPLLQSVSTAIQAYLPVASQLRGPQAPSQLSCSPGRAVRENTFPASWRDTVSGVSFAPLKPNTAPKGQLLLCDLLQISGVPCSGSVVRGAPTWHSWGPDYHMPERLKPSTPTPPGYCPTVMAAPPPAGRGRSLCTSRALVYKDELHPYTSPRDLESSLVQWGR